MAAVLKKLPLLIIAVVLCLLGILQIHSGKMLFLGLLFHQTRIQPPANLYAAAAFFSFALCLACLVPVNKRCQSAAKYLFIVGFILIGVATFLNP